jgi:hypothetical protein
VRSLFRMSRPGSPVHESDDCGNRRDSGLDSGKLGS